MKFSPTFLLLLSAVTAALAHRQHFATPEPIGSTYYSSQHHTSKLRARSAEDPLTIATKHVEETIAPGSTFKLSRDHYTDDDTGITHAYFVQTYNGIDIENAQVNVNVKRDGTILSAGTSFLTGDFKKPPVVRRRQQLDPAEALKGVFEKLKLPGKADNAVAVPLDSMNGGEEGAFTILNVEGTLSEPKAHLRWYQTPEKELKLIWRIESDFGENWLVMYADAQEKGVVYGTTDYVADAQYLVYPLGINDPTDGERVLLSDPFKASFSPDGWHTTGGTTFTTTQGNNGIAHENWDGGSDFLNNYRPDGGSDLIFSFPYNRTNGDPKSYIDAAVTQLFYTSNIYHDLLEALGFTEQAGNFEEVNTGAGGLGGDAVQLNAQDGAGTNNANFATPADGSRPRMRMYIWTGTPPRDGDLELGIILHEYTHGLSNRLTGGPGNSGCLSGLESGGMGEGWSDAFPTAIRLKPGDTRNTDYGMGNWANGQGIRQFPYSTNLVTNPVTYETINGPAWQAVHSIGNVWATMLYEVVWNLVDKHGYDAEIFPTFRPGTSVPTGGRALALKLILEGMKLHPCRPTFLSARDGIIDADLALTQGENFCDIWRAFAKRGLGVSASLGTGSRTRTNGFDVPEECEPIQEVKPRAFAGPTRFVM